MTQRKSRRVDTPLPRAEPSRAFLSTGPNANAKARSRISDAGKAVADAGRWPTLERVKREDRRIKTATLGRNTDALDEARRSWLSARAHELVEAGTFPTIELIAPLAGTLQARHLRNYETALLVERRRWVAIHGPHPDWQEADAAENCGVHDHAASSTRHEAAPAPGATAPRGTEPSETTDLLQRQIKRMQADRKRDKARIADLEKELKEANESLRRVLVSLRRLHAADLAERPETRRS